MVIKANHQMVFYLILLMSGKEFLFSVNSYPADLLCDKDFGVSFWFLSPSLLPLYQFVSVSYDFVYFLYFV